jgi:ParB-like chromosome segregation protein Spo0J
MDFHPVANLFPLLEGPDFDAFVEDVRSHGLQQPIVRHDDQILDGRNRWRACRAAGVEPRFVDFDGPDPVAFVVSANLHRRHLTPSQLAWVADQIANLKPGRPAKKTAEISAVSQEAAAEMVGVSRGSVQNAAVVREKGVRALGEMVGRGEVAVYPAAAVAHLPEPEQREVVAAGPKAVAEKAREMREKAPPMPEGPSAKEAARNAPEVLWAKHLHDLWCYLNSVRNCGGPVELAKGWSAEARRGQAAELREVAARLTDMADRLEEM